jgi:hypothetical protein
MTDEEAQLARVGWWLKCAVVYTGIDISRGDQARLAQAFTNAMKSDGGVLVYAPRLEDVKEK